jgi:hypothetical protein
MGTYWKKAAGRQVKVINITATDDITLSTTLDTVADLWMFYSLALPALAGAPGSE